MCFDKDKCKSVIVLNFVNKLKLTMDYPTEEEEFEMMYQQEMDVMGEMNEGLIINICIKYM